MAENRVLKELLEAKKKVVPTDDIIPDDSYIRSILKMNRKVQIQLFKERMKKNRAQRKKSIRENSKPVEP